MKKEMIINEIKNEVAKILQGNQKRFLLSHESYSAEGTTKKKDYEIVSATYAQKTIDQHLQALLTKYYISVSQEDQEIKLTSKYTCITVIAMD